MNDAELTSLAAKAFGNAPEIFNPLTDDGDAMRLRNKLSAMIIDEGNCVFVAIYRSNITSIEIREMYVGDLEGGYASDSSVSAATRRAIVRAAAQIGETL